MQPHEDDDGDGADDDGGDGADNDNYDDSNEECKREGGKEEGEKR